MRITARICYSVLLVILVSVTNGSSQTIQSGENLTVVDGNGKKVGPVVGAFTRWVIVALRVERVPILVFVYRNRFAGDAVLFESSDCSGTPLLFSDDDPLPIWKTGVGGPGSTVYVPDGDARTVTVRSSSDVGGRCFSWVATRLVRPARALINLDNHFTPPFTLR